MYLGMVKVEETIVVVIEEEICDFLSVTAVLIDILAAMVVVHFDLW